MGFSSLITPLSNTWEQLPYKDTGQLLGGQRNHQTELNGLVSDVFRNADQTQDVVQAGRAYSGANTVNNLTQDEAIKQDGLSVNTKNVNIEPPVPSFIDPNFHFNYLQRVITDYDAADYLSRGVANITQNQRSGQNAFSRLLDFDGNQSVVVNNLNQIEDVDQTLQANLDVLATIHETPFVYDNARFREIFADLSNQDAQAIMSTAQRQGYLVGQDGPNPSVQSATADGAFATNNLVDVATANQLNLVTLNGVIDLQRLPFESLSPRSADFQVKMNGEGGAMRAVNSNSAVQEQALVQEASGAIEENGIPTENGGAADNNASLSQFTNEKSTVLHDIIVLV